MALFYFFLFLKFTSHQQLFSTRTAKTLWYFSVFSFVLKMLLQVGTVFPRLGNEVYGDRPVIIGFLHLVFLGFISFFILSMLTESGYLTKKTKVILLPLIVFSTGIFANEFLLMVQGLGILFKTNNEIYKWLLWGAAIVLVIGALFIAFARLSMILENKKKATRRDGFQ
jgi:hypothetical protein